MRSQFLLPELILPDLGVNVHRALDRLEKRHSSLAKSLAKSRVKSGDVYDEKRLLIILLGLDHGVRILRIGLGCKSPPNYNYGIHPRVGRNAPRRLDVD